MLLDPGTSGLDDAAGCEGEGVACARGGAEPGRDVALGIGRVLCGNAGNLSGCTANATRRDRAAGRAPKRAPPLRVAPRQAGLEPARLRPARRDLSGPLLGRAAERARSPRPDLRPVYRGLRSGGPERGESTPRPAGLNASARGRDCSGAPSVDNPNQALEFEFEPGLLERVTKPRGRGRSLRLRPMFRPSDAPPRPWPRGRRARAAPPASRRALASASRSSARAAAAASSTATSAWSTGSLPGSPAPRRKRSSAAPVRASGRPSGRSSRSRASRARTRRARAGPPDATAPPAAPAPPRWQPPVASLWPRPRPSITTASRARRMTLSSATRTLPLRSPSGW